LNVLCAGSNCEENFMFFYPFFFKILKMTPIGVILCGESIAIIPEV
jgi:hypothetical protein